MYQALYRKWRPARFDDVVGQENITMTLQNEVSQGQISHAYIFEGSSLSKKESAARSFLKTLAGTSELEICADYYEVRAQAEKGRSVRSIKDQDMEELQANLWLLLLCLCFLGTSL